MKFKRANDFPKDVINANGFEGMTANWLWTAEDGMEHFAMRLMEFEPGGQTSRHSHLEEHQLYFLEGQPAVIDSEGVEHRFAPGDTLYCGPGDLHQVKNVGTTPMKMICMVPLLPGGNGKTTTPVPGKE